jgi:hypothetical protein
MKYNSATLIESSKDVLVIYSDTEKTSEILSVSKRDKINLVGVKLLKNDTIELLYSHDSSAHQADITARQVLENEDKIADLYNKLAAAGAGTGTTPAPNPFVGSFSNASGPEESETETETETETEGSIGTFVFTTAK